MQGARLTAYELVHDKIPATLVCDSAAAALMCNGDVDAIVLGADRIAANGDVANKIGTLSLACAAAHAGVPFFVAGPISTVDLTLPTGDGIPIEERAAKEMTHTRDGKRAVVEGIEVWNPAFDVAPAKLIAGIITEFGTVWPNAEGAFDMAGFIKNATQGGPQLAAPLTDAPQAFTEDALKEYISSYPEIASQIGGDSASWSVKEVGDGNINFVFIVEGERGGIVVKQALPYVRCIGESWPLTESRAAFEAKALIATHSMCPEHVPEVYKFDAKRSSIFMKYLAPPNIILRYGLIDGIIYPKLADQISSFMADTLFKSSLLCMSTGEYRVALADYAGNSSMCELTEQVIFTDPYGDAEHNRWNAPFLDDAVKALRADAEAKDAISELKHAFCEHAEALIHGDLHTGSVMVTDATMHVIDPEFAFYGPMGFDIGAFLANLLLAYFASDGHETTPGAREEQRTWLASCIRDVWRMFSTKFVALWTAGGSSAAYPELVFGGKAEELALCQQTYLRGVFEDSMGFAGAKMIRRIVGVAHVADMDRIEDAEVRAKCEGRALEFGRKIMVGRKAFKDIDAVVDLAVSMRK